MGESTGIEIAKLWKEIKAERQADTKNKKKFLASAIGISIGIYIDKAVSDADIPGEITIKLK